MSGGLGSVEFTPPCHRPDESGSSTRSLRRSDLADFWEIIGHTASRELGLRRCFAVSRLYCPPRDDDEGEFGRIFN